MTSSENAQPPKDPKANDRPVKVWLERNKIFFDTIAAFLLTVMALIVSISQSLTARQQWKAEQRRAAIERTANWQRLRDSVWELLDLYPKTGTATLDKLDPQSKAMWFSKVRSILDSQTDNLVLIEDRVCLGCWRNAISNAKTSKDLFETADMSWKPEWCSISANSIMKDVMYVWEKLVLDSSEVSATGGRPNEAEK